MKKKWIITFALIALISLITTIYATPAGTTVTYVSNSTKAATIPDNRTDDKGTITVITIDTLQQDDRWKAYVGNVSGKLTLDDANSYTIYDWTISGSVLGTVFATRNSTVQWSTINCSNISHTQAEETYLSHSFTSSDNIENTFMSTNHTSFIVGERTMTGCNFTATYVNDAEVLANDTAIYQEMTLWDGVGAFIYASRINDNEQGYRPDSTYDFQMIVPERAVPGALVTYFFFVELQ